MESVPRRQLGAGAAPSLDHAYLRVGRAQEHLAELKVLHDAICAAQREATIVQSNPQTVIQPGETLEILRVETGQTPIPARCGVLVGDTINSLRSALDYLVGQLAWLDSGRRQAKTQFPIEAAPEDFKGRRRFYLRGVNDLHVAAIEALQPYNGAEWAERLRVISNRDKHDELIIVLHDVLVTPIVTKNPADGDGPAHSVHVELQPVLRVELGNGVPLIETLELLHARVVETLDAFQAEF